MSTASDYWQEESDITRRSKSRCAGGNDNDNNGNILFSVHLSQGMRINYVDVHYANFALIILMNLTNFNNILASRLVHFQYTRHISQTILYVYIVFVRENALHLNIYNEIHFL